MAQNVGADGTCENWELTKDMLLEDQTPRKTPKRVLSLLPSSPQRAVVLLALLLALSFVFLLALTIANIRRVSAVREELERAQLRDQQSHTTAWHNLSEVQHTLDMQLSAELRAIHSRLLNVSQELEEVQQKMAQCRAECGKELRDRMRALEGRDELQPALKQLEELRQEQSHISTLLSTALEETHNLTEMFCTRCPAGWQQFAKTCYYFSTEKKSWIEARAACSMLGAQLAIVNSELENKFLANHIMEIRAFWLGLSDMQKEGDWEWLDGQPLSISFWKKGEPNNVGQHGEDCATVSSSGLWNDATCTSPEAWICERSC
ncbi:low affinity immunoglobulin epsilon Fc receptor-like isoform X2 [Phasianus colchicus]|uniref:low affinity immunoglobulin epsilon Fc receptor-like isoform X2 n=1 Tax=Phasianus colchicus TaxID=9054 RepID=UPI00129E38DD|nr:low affinity immunoglobulin epsilon Fc receptor-like isoform X2 [Phasianus colchicus]